MKAIHTSRNLLTRISKQLIFAIVLESIGVPWMMAWLPFSCST